ncbi:DUF4209 domain-containing protein [Vibrio hepatarius]|uniref:DUF4209 domain-containing protein n=1 Tax=Vibrio hepatarius TaxID=171383 RepID=UPI00148CA547|nr:DUF4209 domain-containing protein [Vibrio hepatarius]NOI13386.1 DUF4209 domain-containing protein [Vibrio hepatarius]
MTVLVDYLETFCALEWDKNYRIEPEYEHSYYFHLYDAINLESDESKKKVLNMLQKALMLNLRESWNVNNPYTTSEATGTRTPLLFEPIELEFFDAILPLIDDRNLRARLADILWIWTRGKKNIDWARLAIDCFTQDDIDADKWFISQEHEWERAIRLSLQIRDTPRNNCLVERVLEHVANEESELNFLVLRLVELLFRTEGASDRVIGTVSKLIDIAECFKGNGDFYQARSYFKLSADICEQADRESYIDYLTSCAECYELEGDSRARDSSMAANSFYESSIQAYRKIPNKDRSSRNINASIDRLLHKVAESGRQMLNEMVEVNIPMPDVSDEVEKAVLHVSGRFSTESAVGALTGFNICNSYEELEVEASESLRKSVIKHLVSTVKTSRDGRVISKNGITEDIYSEMIESYMFRVSYYTKVSIFPAIQKLLSEHTIARELLEFICRESPLIADKREKIVGLGLWLGFEYDFTGALHILCPQVENMVRLKLREHGVHVTRLDENGIEEHIGLGALLDKPEVVDIFGKLRAFELKAIFTESEGANYRNEVAHGLFDDNDGDTYHAVYAWWFILKIIVESLWSTNR